jgi:hypothetical protein
VTSASGFSKSLLDAKVRDRNRLALNPDRLHFFDRASQAAI